MGIRVKKSIKLGGGTRLNLSKKGIGASAGVKGFRVGVGPRGITRTASIPGTGISYRTETSLKGSKQVSNNDVQYNTIEYELPEGVYIPKVRKNITGYILSGIAFLILGFFIPPLLFVSIVLILIGLKNMVFSKDYKSALYTQLAIKQYIKGNFDSSYDRLEKALDYDPNNEPASNLLYYMQNNRVK